MVVEDGTGLADTNSYVSLYDAVIYAQSHGLAFAVSSPDLTSLGEAALIRASAAIDARYCSSFGGYRVRGREQGLEWPRFAAYDSQGWLIDDATVPKEVIQATCEAAVRELASPGSMLPDLKRGGAIQSVQAGSVSVTYAANATPGTQFTLIDSIMSVLSSTGLSSGGLFGTAVRG